MTFKYTRHSSTILRPIIRIALSHDGFTIPHFALVDSGADKNVFAYEIGELLGLDLPSGEVAEAVGITGEPTELYIHPVTLIVGEESFTTEVAFSRALDKLPYGVVGQFGFFDYFKVEFDLSQEKIQLSRHARPTSS